MSGGRGVEHVFSARSLLARPHRLDAVTGKGGDIAAVIENGPHQGLHAALDPIEDDLCSPRLRARATSSVMAV